MTGAHASRGIYRTPAESRSLRDDVLDAWAEGLDGAQVGVRCGVERSYVDSIVQRARRVGDPRAVSRRRKNRFDGCRISLKEAVVALTRVGIDVDDTAIIVGVTRARVREVLTHAGAI